VICKNFIQICLQLETFGQIPTDSIIFWAIETASFKPGYNWNRLGKLEEFHSDLHTRYIIIFGQITTAQIKFEPIETTSFKFG